MVGLKYYYVRCEWCKNVEPAKLNELSKEHQEYFETYAGKQAFHFCNNCEKMTLQMIIGYDV